MTTRRTFVKQTGLALAALAIAPSCTLTKMPPQPIGIQLYSLRDQIDKNLTEVIEQVAKAGYKQVESFGFAEGKFFGLSVPDFKALLKSNGLSCPSGHYMNADFYMAKDASDRYLQSVIDAALILGHEYITIPYIPDRFRTSAEAYKQLAGLLNRAGETCKKNGLKIAYHNHDFEFKQFGGQTGYDIFLNETDASLVDFEMDIYWVVRAGKDPLALFNKHPKRFTMWHIKDMDKLKPQLNTEVGAGSIDFKPIFNAANLSGIKYYFVEQENFAIDPYQSIKQSIDFIQNKLL